MAWSRESRHKRGYGKQWDKTRERILARDGGLCRCTYCDKRPVRRLASEVDHIVSKAKAKALGWPDERTEADDNLQAINRECHQRKTAEEQGKLYRPQIGPDGWPIEG
jgi:5-methylcytosine-specific restriction protein A